MRLLPFLFACLFVLGCSPPTPAAQCGPLTCGGCCDPTTDRCLTGIDNASCGRDGQSCLSCPGTHTCTSGICSLSNAGGGGGATGGGTGTGGGATTGGGTGGGATTGGGTGGTGGGATGGGTGGGATGGGTGGGATGGGTGGGATGGGTGGGGTGGGTGGSSGTCATNCVNPPGPRCLTANTAVTSTGPGTCINAQCVYPETQTACPYGCAGTACAGPSTCTPSARRCNGSQIQTCNSNGSAWLFAQNCSGTCTAGLCDAPCTPGQVRCNGSTVETCNAGGTAWTTTTACTSQCLSGACLTDELSVNGVTVMMEGEYHYATRVWVRNGGQIQVPAGRKLTLYAPSIVIDVSSSISGSSSGTAACEAPPDDVRQGIRLIANTVTINGSLTWTAGSCLKDGLVVRAGLIDGPGTVTCAGRNQLLYGAGGVAPGLTATSSVKSLMPPAVITSSNYPEGGTYNDDGPPALFSWSKPASTVTGYYYVVGQGSTVPTATSTFIGNEALALSGRPEVGKTFVDVVSLDSTGVVGTVPHEFEVNIVDQPPTLSSSTNPAQGTYSPNPTVVMAWSGGNPTQGYYHLFDRYPSSRPTPQTGVFEPTNKNPAQVLYQNVASGRWWFHMLALDSMGYSTRRAGHYEVDIGSVPNTGTIAGTVKDSADAGIVGAVVVVQRGLYTATTVGGGVYTFNNTIPEGTYEVVAKNPDGGMQSQAKTLSVTAATTTEGYFNLASGSGCPTCADVCSGTACISTSMCAALPAQPGTCHTGACIGDTGLGTTLGVGTTSGSTVGRTNNSVLRYGSTNYYPAPDVTYSFTAPTARTYTIAVSTTSTAALSFYLTTSSTQVCSGVITYQSPWWFDVPDVATLSLNAGQTIYLIVDGASDTGPYSVTVN